MSAAFAKKLGIKYPLIQAPMAGTATPALAAAVSNAGALGSLGVGAFNAAAARKAIQELRGLTSKPFNINFFVHADPAPAPAKDEAWIQTLEPEFAKLGAAPPSGLRTIYKSFLSDGDMLAVVLEEVPPVVSFHFGLPPASVLAQLKAKGIVLFATATSVAEAQAIERAGLDAIVAQGYEAGGHRGIFDPAGADERLSTADLLARLKDAVSLPLIAAGGIMDGHDAARFLDVGAAAVQMGTAFVVADESAADADYRALFKSAAGTRMVDVISGRPARSLLNNWTALQDGNDGRAAPYPNAYDLGKALVAAAKNKGDKGWGVCWSGTGYERVRPMPAAQLVQTIAHEAGWDK